jgi:hypothetical protein
MSKPEYESDDLGCLCRACGREYPLNTSTATNQFLFCSSECEQSARDVEAEYTREIEKGTMT